MPRRDPRITRLLETMDASFDRRGWQGTTLRGALRGMTPAEALRRPGPGRHCAWDYVLHCAYWKYAVRRRFLGEAIGSFPRSPANWPDVPARADARRWKDDVKLLVEQHRLLRRMVERLAPAQLEGRSAKKAWRNIEQLYGVVAHDLYHTGQIQLTRRLTTRSKR